ncbi:hypothetical protein N7468_002773 [Penicillium chermesinum]|uniref:Uncharacterized protein n=1 Tax=Penicillium chermesinum TaxID=63820 RepID=A0A9W9PJ72_9EURO|nr:uncharacterized protein N7468_002773 [Penicillium chermesinum]KAJ5247790.1 hypothetical protein N7468_002773 [Penicillium chermesinum]
MIARFVTHAAKALGQLKLTAVTYIDLLLAPLLGTNGPSCHGALCYVFGTSAMPRSSQSPRAFSTHIIGRSRIPTSTKSFADEPNPDRQPNRLSAVSGGQSQFCRCGCPGDVECFD